MATLMYTHMSTPSNANIFVSVNMLDEPNLGPYMRVDSIY